MNQKLNTIEQLEVLIELAKDMGYIIRHEMMGGVAGGSCEVGGKKILFIDLALGPIDQLESVSRTLASDPQLALYVMNRQQETALRGSEAA